MASLEDFERRFLPALRAAAQKAVDFFLRRNRKATEQALEAEDGRPVSADDLTGEKTYNAALLTQVPPEAAEAFDARYREAADDFDGPPSPLTADQAENLLDAKRSEFLSQLTESLRKSSWAGNDSERIAGILTQAFEENWTTERTAAALEPYLDSDAQSYVAERLARSTIVAAYNAGTVARAQADREADPATELTKTWRATADHRTRHAHREADGQQRPLDEPFDVGGEAIFYPGQPTVSPENFLNCRCTITVSGSPAPVPRDEAVPDEAEEPVQDEPVQDEPEEQAAPATGDEIPDVVDNADTWDTRPEMTGAIDAFRHYTGGAYERINGALRKIRGYRMNAQDKKAAAAMRRAYPNLVPSTRDVQLVRVVRSAEDLFGTSDLNKIIGSTLTEKGFASTSVSPGRFKGRVTLLITAEAGSLLPYIADISDKPGEREVTLPPGRKLLITGGTTGKKGTMMLIAKLVGGPSWNGNQGSTRASLSRSPRETAPGLKPGSTETSTRTRAKSSSPATRPRFSRSTSPQTAPDSSPPSRWEGPLAPLDTLTSDRRMIAARAGDIRTRPLPLPLLFQSALAPEHDGGIPVGVIDTVEMRDGQLWGTGRFDTQHPDGADVARRIRDGFLGWVSVDLDDATYELAHDNDGEPYDVATDWRLMGATLVSHPAFADGAKIQTTTLQEDAVAASSGRIQAVTDTYAGCGCAQSAHAADPEPPARGESSAPWAGLALTIEVAGRTIEQNFTADTLTYTVTGGDSESQGETVDLTDASADDDEAGFRFAWTQPDGTRIVEEVDLAEGTVEIEATAEDGTVTEQSGTVTPAKPADQPEEEAEAVVAAATPDLPPAAWFDNPGLSAPTPLTIDDDGRVFGHLASWQTGGRPTCHTGSRPGSCTTVPHSAAAYAYFHVGAVRADSGQDIAVGNLVIGTDHAAMSADYAGAGAHYAHTGAAVAAVRAGEDAHGIWVAGTLLPHVTDEQVATLRRAPLSGDWRSIGGQLELVAALAVNTPGFPIPRARVDDYARTASLTAAGILNPAPTAPAPGDVAGEVIRRLDARTLHTETARIGSERRGRRARSLVASMLAAPRTPRRPSGSRTAAAEEDGKDSEGEAAGAELSAEDVAFIAELLGVPAEDVEPVELSPDDVEEIIAILDDTDSDKASPDAQAPAGDDVQDAGNVTAANWVTKAGGLPRKVRSIADHLLAKGFAEGHAIATAVNTVKKWCATGDVTQWEGKQTINAKSRAETCAAVARWETMKAEARAS